MTGVKSELGPTALTVAANVRRHRDRVGWGYARLARELTRLGRDIPSLGLSRIESGERRVDTDDLTALAVAFGVSPITLLMPQGDGPEHSVQLTGTAAVPGPRVWSWLNGSYPLTGSVLTFYNHALPEWERNRLEALLGDHAGDAAIPS